MDVYFSSYLQRWQLIAYIINKSHQMHKYTKPLTLLWKKGTWKCLLVVNIDNNVTGTSGLGLCIYMVSALASPSGLQMKNKRSELSLWAGGVLKKSRYAAWQHLGWSKSGPNLISDHMSTASTQKISYTPYRLFIFVKLDVFSAHLAWMRQVLWLKTLKNAVLLSMTICYKLKCSHLPLSTDDTRHVGLPRV